MYAINKFKLCCVPQKSQFLSMVQPVSQEKQREKYFFSELITFNSLYKGKGEVGTAVDKPYP